MSMTNTCYAIPCCYVACLLCNYSTYDVGTLALLTHCVPCASRSVVTLRRYLMVGTVTLFVSSALYVELLKVPHTGGGSFALLQFLFGKEAIEEDVVVTLCFFTVYKFFATLLSVTLPLPVGLFTPTFVIGGLLGRIVGKICKCR